MSTIYKKQIVAFIDLLGFTEVLRDEEKAEKILDALKKIKSGETKTASSIIELDGQITNIYMKPTITAFSDNVVISFPENELKAPASWRHATIEILNVIQMIAVFAIQEGFLLRGGMTIGNLHHEDGIVLGNAHIDAYYLESKVAIYPRIVASRELIKCFKADGSGGTYECFQQDSSDGMFYLDYLPAIRNNSPRAFEEFSSVIDKNIFSLSKVDKKIKELAKWKWFERYYKRVS